MVKLIICVKRKTGMTRKEFDAYWQNRHGPLVKSVPEFMRHVRKYVQCHVVENSVPLGVAAPYDGVAELWFRQRGGDRRGLQRAEVSGDYSSGRAQVR